MHFIQFINFNCVLIVCLNFFFIFWLTVALCNFYFQFLYRGSAIAKIVGANAARLPNFNDRVTMYVFEEMIDGKKLTEIINETHENVKYLPGHKLPANVVSTQITPNQRIIKFSIFK